MNWYIGQKVISISNFDDVRKVWGYNYPYKDQILEIKKIEKHHRFNFYLLYFESCEFPLCERNFRPLDEFKAITFSKVLNKELISCN